jgi:hypothetical protein
LLLNIPETYKQWKSQLETIRNAAKAKLSR